MKDIARINFASFWVCLVSIVCAIAIGLLGIWRVIPWEDGTLWRLLGTCGVTFAGAVCASMAIRCFKTNE